VSDFTGGAAGDRNSLRYSRRIMKQQRYPRGAAVRRSYRQWLMKEKASVAALHHEQWLVMQAARQQYEDDWIISRGFGEFTRWNWRNDTGAHIYLLFLGNTLQYIGQTRTCVSNRLSCHTNTKDYDSVWVKPVSADQLDSCERELIRRFKPPFNQLLYQSTQSRNQS
jgi:hypothetical protein